MIVLIRAALALGGLVVVTGCSLLTTLAFTAPQAPPLDDPFPTVIGVELRPSGERTFDVAVEISSPYDSPERYADGWRVLDPAGNVLGTHRLMHDHAAEQPFTRTQRDLQIPVGIAEVTVEGRDLANGFGGSTMTVQVPE